MLAVGNDRQFGDCMETIGTPELARDELYATNAARIQNRQQLIETMSAQLLSNTNAFWLNAFAERGVPSGPISDVGEVLSGAYAVERGLVRSLSNSAGDPVPTVVNPVAFDGTPVRYEFAPPLLGEHTDEVLREWLGYSPEMIAELRSQAAI